MWIYVTAYVLIGVLVVRLAHQIRPSTDPEEAGFPLLAGVLLVGMLVLIWPIMLFTRVLVGIGEAVVWLAGSRPAKPQEPLDFGKDLLE